MQETNASAKGGNQNILLKMEGICKEFPGVKALDNVSLTGEGGNRSCADGREWCWKIYANEMSVRRIF